jgi:hypothetical protein
LKNNLIGVLALQQFHPISDGKNTISVVKSGTQKKWDGTLLNQLLVNRVK